MRAQDEERQGERNHRELRAKSGFIVISLSLFFVKRAANGTVRSSMLTQLADQKRCDFSYAHQLNALPMTNRAT
jgi:hypothetical protein